MALLFRLEVRYDPLAPALNRRSRARRAVRRRYDCGDVRSVRRDHHRWKLKFSCEDKTIWLQNLSSYPMARTANDFGSCPAAITGTELLRNIAPVAAIGLLTLKRFGTKKRIFARYAHRTTTRRSCTHETR